MRWTAPFLLVASACATTIQPIPPAWLGVPEAPRIRALQLDAAGKVTTTAPPPKEQGPIRLDGHRLFNADKPITVAFAAIDSFDYHAARGEVAFSAKRGASFDIGLVAADGSALNWIPADAADEIGVTWAPRGNKISYIVRAKHGDVVRTFHVPTSFQYAVDFGTATIHALAWDPPAERYAVSYSTLDASDRVEVLRYDGTDRRMSVNPSIRISADVVAFGPTAYALRPLDVRYNEKLPVAIWVAERFDWSDARAALMKNARVATIVTTALDDELWRRVGETAWLDASRVFVVNGRRDGATSIVADPALPPGRYRGLGSDVAVAPAAIQSFAAGFIAEQLKRTNGSRR